MSPEPNSTSETIAANSQKLAALQADVCRLVDQIDRWNGKAGSVMPPSAAPGVASDGDAASAQQAAQIAALSATVRQLEARLRGLEDLTLVAPRKPMRVRLIELVIGREYYRPWWRHSAVPGVTVVIPACAGDDEAAAVTVRSVLRQSQAGWDVVVVGPEPGERLRQALGTGAGRARHVLVNGSAWDCLDKGLSEASASGPGTVIGIVHPGQQLEPTAAASMMRFFRDHPRAMAAYFEKIVRSGPWRMPLLRGKRMDVYALLAEEGTNGWGHGGVFFRRRALGMVGGYKPAMRSAAEWHLYLRLTRMFGICRAMGQVLSISQGEATSERCGEYLDFEQARQEFLGNFGAAGRARCRLIHLLHTLAHLAEPDDPPMPLPANASGDEAIADVKIECPLSGEEADRLLFTVPDENGNPCYVYRCGGSIAAMVRCAEEPRGGAAGLSLANESPAALPRESPDEDALIAALLKQINWDNPSVRTLVAADSSAGDLLAQQTRWNITRLPADVPLAETALILPEELRFDVIWAASAIRRSADPAGLLRTLRSVLGPGGIVAFAGPNLDSPSQHRLGPAWPGWNAPRHPLILGRRGVRELARLSDLRVLWLRGRGEEWLALLQAE
jgi:hypothetical protein